MCLGKKVVQAFEHTNLIATMCTCTYVYVTSTYIIQSKMLNRNEMTVCDSNQYILPIKIGNQQKKKKIDEKKKVIKKRNCHAYLYESNRIKNTLKIS